MIADLIAVVASQRRGAKAQRRRASQLTRSAESAPVDDRRHRGIARPRRTRAFIAAGRLHGPLSLRHSGPAYAEGDVVLLVHSSIEGGAEARVCDRGLAGAPEVRPEASKDRGRALVIGRRPLMPLCHGVEPWLSGRFAVDDRCDGLCVSASLRLCVELRWLRCSASLRLWVSALTCDTCDGAMLGDFAPSRLMAAHSGSLDPGRTGGGGSRV